MRHWIRLLSLAVIMLTATACGQVQSPTRQIGSGAADGTPTTMSASPTTASYAPLPTPDASGQYNNLTFTQAQQLAPFHLTQPTWLPSYLHVEHISASVPNRTDVQSSTPSANATPPTGAVQVVSMNFLGPWPKLPAVTINEVKQGTPLGPHWDPRTIVGTTTITIAGHPVTRAIQAMEAVYPPPGPNAQYVWTDQGTTFELMAVIADPTTEQDVEHMIASMLQPATAMATPWVETPSATPAVPTPDSSGWYDGLTFAQAQRVAPYHLVQPTWVPAYLEAGRTSATVLNITEVQPQSPATEPPSSGPVQVVQLTFFGRALDSKDWVFISELKQGTPIGPLGGTGPAPSTTTTMTITIAGQPVTRTTWGFATPVPISPQDGFNARYVWTDHGTTFQLAAFVDAPLTEQDVEHMIASMIKESNAAGTPEPHASTATPASSYVGPIPRAVSYGGDTGITLAVPPDEASPAVSWQSAVSHCSTCVTDAPVSVSLTVATDLQAGQANSNGSITPVMDQTLVYVLAQSGLTCSAAGPSGTPSSSATSESYACVHLSFVDADSGNDLYAVDGADLWDPSQRH